MKQVAGVLIWISVAAAIIGFFLPWGSIDLRQPDVIKQLSSTAQGQEMTKHLTDAASSVFGTMKRGVKTITDKLPTDKLLELQGIPTNISGVQIPQMANQKNAQLAVAIIEFFTADHEHIGLKSYAVYLLPGIALLGGLLLSFFGGRFPIVLGTIIVCAGVAVVGFWKLLTTNTQMLFIAITIGPGVWLSIWAYVGLALAGLMKLLTFRTLRGYLAGK